LKPLLFRFDQMVDDCYDVGSIIAHLETLHTLGVPVIFYR
jgi:hypothetical protein